MNREARPKFRFTKSNIIVFVLSGLLLISVIILLILVFRSGSNTTTQPTIIPEEKFAQTYSENIQSSLKEIDDKLTSVESAEEKANLLLDKVNRLYNAESFLNEDNKEAIKENLYEAESIFPSYRTAFSIYNYEKEYGDEEKADEYYKLYEERLGNNDLMEEKGRG